MRQCMEGEEGSGIKRMVCTRCRVNIFIISRSEIWTLKKPKTISKKLKNVFRVPDLRGMLHMFKGVEARAGVWIWGFLWCQGLNLGTSWGRKKEGIQRRGIAEEDVII